MAGSNRLEIRSRGAESAVPQGRSRLALESTPPAGHLNAGQSAGPASYRAPLRSSRRPADRIPNSPSSSRPFYPSGNGRTLLDRGQSLERPGHHLPVSNRARAIAALRKSGSFDDETLGVRPPCLIVHRGPKGNRRPSVGESALICRHRSSTVAVRDAEHRPDTRKADPSRRRDGFIDARNSPIRGGQGSAIGWINGGI